MNTPIDALQEQAFADRLILGDLVEAIPPFALVCGSGRYDCAVVVQINPLVLVSELGDMRWTRVMASQIKPIGTAHHLAKAAAFGRLFRDRQDGEV